MQVLLSQYCKIVPGMAGKWADVDTSFLFRDQYNVRVDGALYSVSDKDVKAVKDDARAGMAKCRYCGALVKAEDAEAHFQEKESGECRDGHLNKNCFWCQPHIESIERPEPRMEESPDGTFTKTTSSIKKGRYRCAYNKDGSHGCGCTLRECRAHGVEPFTWRNTFFLKYPTGFRPRRFCLKDAPSGWTADFSGPQPRILFDKKIGSLSLCAYAWNFDGRSGNIDYFAVQNARKRILFNYDPDAEGRRFIVYDQGLPSCHAHLDVTPDQESRVLMQVMSLLATAPQDTAPGAPVPTA